MATDVLIVSLGSTHGLREADAELADSMRRGGASVEVVTAAPVREWRTYALIELAWASSARRAAVDGIARCSPHAVLYSSTTAALRWPVAGAIRFDAPAAGNRPGRHGLWQRPVERRRFREASLLVPWSEGALAEAPSPRAEAAVVPVPVEPSGVSAPAKGLSPESAPAEGRDIAAITYGANPAKKGLDRVLAAWEVARRPGEELLVAGLDGADHEGVRYLGSVPRAEYRSLLRRARVFVTAPRREDHGLAQLEALADGCVLVTTESPGPYAALAMARELDPRLVGHDLAWAIRTALDDPRPGYAARAADLTAPLSRERIDAVVREELLPRLLR